MNSLKILKFPYFGEIDCTNLVIWQIVPIFQSFAKFVQFGKPKTRPGYPGFLKSKPAFSKPTPGLPSLIAPNYLVGYANQKRIVLIYHLVRWER